LGLHQHTAQLVSAVDFTRPLFRPVLLTAVVGLVALGRLLSSAVDFTQPYLVLSMVTFTATCLLLFKRVFKRLLLLLRSLSRADFLVALVGFLAGWLTILRWAGRF